MTNTRRVEEELRFREVLALIKIKRDVAICGVTRTAAWYATRFVLRPNSIK